MTDYRIISSTEPCGERLNALISSLPQWRREVALRYKFEQGRRECCLSYLLLCDMLRESFGITSQPRFIIGEHGKPTLDVANGDIMFNISHCKRAVACIISDTENVGIDVECTGRYTTALADYCMSDSEKDNIAIANNPDGMFTELWTRKEALLKLTGEGITDDLKTVLSSSRTNDITLISGLNIDRGYAWSLARRRKIKN